MFVRYNQKTYKVERVDFDQSPETTFDKSGTQVRILVNHNRFNRSPTKSTTRPATMRKPRTPTSHY